jgi:hypothetical protein
MRNYSLSYARELNFFSKYFDKITAGVTLKLIHGYFYAGTEKVNSFASINDRSEIVGRAEYLARTSFSQDIGIRYGFDEDDKTNNNFQVFPAPAGSGFGFDIGTAAVFEKVWKFSFSLTDIGSINWKKRTARFLAEGDILLNDVVSEAQRDSIIDIISGDGEYTDGFSTRLPLALRMGAAYSFEDDRDFIPGNLIVAFDYNQGFNKLPGNSTAPRFSVAGDWKPAQWGAVRMGFSFGGLDGFNWAAGLGFESGVIELNIATTDLQSVPLPNNSKQISFAFNSRWRFR